MTRPACGVLKQDQTLLLNSKLTSVSEHESVAELFGVSINCRGVCIAGTACVKQNRYVTLNQMERVRICIAETQWTRIRYTNKLNSVLVVTEQLG